MSGFQKIKTIFYCIAASIFLCAKVLGASDLRPMGYEDIVKLSKPQSVHVSPIGTKIAFVTRQGNIEEDRSVDRLYLWNYADNKQEEIFVAEKILQVTWGDKGGLYFLVQEGEEYTIVQYDNQTINIVFSSLEPIQLFSVSPDEKNIYHTLTRMITEELTKHYRDTGYVYRWERDICLTILERNYRHKEKEEIRCFSLGSKTSRLVTSFSCLDMPVQSRILHLQISEDNRYVYITMFTMGHAESGKSTGTTTKMHVWDDQDKCWIEDLPDFSDGTSSVCWIGPDRFVFQKRDQDQKALSLYQYDIASKQSTELMSLSPPWVIHKLFWNKQERMLYAFGKSSIAKISLDNQLAEIRNLPLAGLKKEFSIDQQMRICGWIEESSNVAPEIIVYDLSKEKIIKKTDLNPDLQNCWRGHVEKLKITTKDGFSSVGYLVHPFGERQGKRYPIIIATYGFKGNFIADAEWHSTFPAQTLAAEGYLVLLLNTYGSSQKLVGNPQKARETEGWNMLAIFEHAIDVLDEMGIGDSNKVGIYGWSHGGFIVEFLLSHSHKFHVACLGEGGDYNPSGFWMCGDLRWAHVYENMFGGPPWGESLQNYLQYSPFFQVDKIQSPLLMEFSSTSADFALEMYVPLRYLHVPAELVVYDGEKHNFEKPKARMASMERKVDWFNFWLLDKKDPCPEKIKQYERWTEMKNTFFMKSH